MHVAGDRRDVHLRRGEHLHDASGRPKGESNVSHSKRGAGVDVF
jgi:hypothetical protein